MQLKSMRSRADWSIPELASRAGGALFALAGGGAFALDTWRRGWTWPAAAAIAVTLGAAGCAALGRATRRPSLERAARPLAFAGIGVALAGVACHLSG
jgi:hypothetical protein